MQLTCIEPVTTNWTHTDLFTIGLIRSLRGSRIDSNTTKPPFHPSLLKRRRCRARTKASSAMNTPWPQIRPSLLAVFDLPSQRRTTLAPHQLHQLSNRSSAPFTTAKSNTSRLSATHEVHANAPPEHARNNVLITDSDTTQQRIKESWNDVIQTWYKDRERNTPSSSPKCRDSIAT